MNSETKLIMSLLSKYQIISFFDEKGFEISKIFMQILASSLTQHRHPLFAIMNAVRSFAYESSNEERVVMCTHLARHIISEKQKDIIAHTLYPMIKKMDIKFNVNTKLYSELIAKIKDDAKYT